jgi:hypothetical protein
MGDVSMHKRSCSAARRDSAASKEGHLVRGSSPLHDRDTKQTRSNAERNGRLLDPKHAAGMRADCAAREGEELGQEKNSDGNGDRDEQRADLGVLCVVRRCGGLMGAGEDGWRARRG